MITLVHVRPWCAQVECYINDLQYHTVMHIAIIADEFSQNIHVLI